ncbi:MAG TPA: NADH-quinone oxidoreductase subunit J [Planctomycetota bacterium]|nr:NADH-quinone oxidoreductase subunit J [Planctomycetota bacterium]
MAEVLFYALSALAVLFALGVVLVKSPMMSVLNLLGTFFCLSGVYLLSGFQFMFAAQILVYAGAILVLFLFVIMLLNLSAIDARSEASPGLLRGTGAKIGAAVAVAIGAALLISTSAKALRQNPVVPTPDGIDGFVPLSAELFGRYSLPFEAMSMLLLATMVAVVLLAKRQRGGREKEQR